MNRTFNAEKADRVREHENDPVDLAARARRADPDRFLCAMFAPAAVREDAFALCCFHHELERAVYGVSKRSSHGPLAALIRLGWWREVLENARQDWRGDGLAIRVREIGDRDRVPIAVLRGMVDAYQDAAAEADGPEIREDMLNHGPGGLQVALARLVGETDATELARAAAAGAAHALARSIRQHGERPSPALGAEVRRQLATVEGPLPVAGRRVALLPAVLAARDLSPRSRHAPTRGLADRLAVIWTGLRPSGRLRFPDLA